MIRGTAIKIENLEKAFRQRKKGHVYALRGVSLEVPYGGVFGFLGPNGAGKSTTIKILTGQIRATRGQAYVGGVPVDRVSSRKKIGYLPENPSFFDFLTGREYLALVGSIQGLQSVNLEEAIDRGLARVGLSDAGNRRIRTFSKGMVQRLGIAQSLIHNPDILIWDEPMSGLDPIGRALVRDLLVELKRSGKTVFFSSHITSDVEQVCDHVAILVKGRLVAEASVAEIVRQQSPDTYVVTRRLPQGNLVEDVISQDLLPTYLSQAESNGEKVELVRPFTTALESFFLSKVEAAEAVVDPDA